MSTVLSDINPMSCDHRTRFGPQAWRDEDLCRPCLRVRWQPGNPDFLQNVLRRIDDGPGFVVIEGLPVAGVSLDGAEDLALDVATAFGEPMAQDGMGQLTCLVRDEGHVIRPPHETGGLLARGAKSSKSRERLEFHNDNAPRWRQESVDLLGMLAVHQAASGGQTLLASARAAWQTLLLERPAAARLLCEDFTFDRTVAASGEPEFSTGPVFSPYGRFVVRWNRVRIAAAAAHSGRPLSAAAIDAFDALEAVLARRESRHCFTLRPGECLLLDDAAVLHGRTAYRDGTDGSPRRCLVRFWVRRSDPAGPSRRR